VNDTSVPRTLRAAQPHGNHVLQTADRSSYTNTSGISDPDAMSNIALGFSHKRAWPGKGNTNLILGSPQDIDHPFTCDRGEIHESVSYTYDERYILQDYTQSPELSQSMVLIYTILT
jgi:hypothetical protein